MAPLCPKLDHLDELLPPRCQSQESCWISEGHEGSAWTVLGERVSGEFPPRSPMHTPWLEVVGGGGIMLIEWGIDNVKQEGVDVGVESSPMGLTLYESLGFLLTDRKKVQVDGKDKNYWLGRCWYSVGEFSCGEYRNEYWDFFGFLPVVTLHPQHSRWWNVMCVNVIMHPGPILHCSACEPHVCSKDVRKWISLVK